MEASSRNAFPVTSELNLKNKWLQGSLDQHPWCQKAHTTAEVGKYIEQNKPLVR